MVQGSSAKLTSWGPSGGYTPEYSDANPRDPLDNLTPLAVQEFLQIMCGFELRDDAGQDPHSPADASACLPIPVNAGGLFA